MPRLIRAVPKFRRHASGQAFVQLGGRNFYLGKWRSRAAQLAYDQFIQQWIAAGRPGKVATIADPTIKAVILRFWRHSKQTVSAGELNPRKSALRILQRLYGQERAAEFGAKKLKIVRQAMIRLGWTRDSINKQIGRLRLMFVWAASEEMVPDSVWQSLSTVAGLRQGTSGVRESEPVTPVADDIVEVTLKHLPSLVADMVRIQRLLGCRPDEICQLRPADIDRSQEVWSYRPRQHKNKHRGKNRVIFIGPRAQDILTPYLDVAEEDYCFSPRRSEQQRRAEQHRARKTPLGQGNRPGTNRAAAPKRSSGNRYTAASYCRAITRACEIAFGMPAHLRKRFPKTMSEEERKPLREAASKWRQKHCWAPNQLRHTTGTKIRASHGAEAAQVVLGHARLDTTEIYAERDLKKAAEVVREMG